MWPPLSFSALALGCCYWSSDVHLDSVWCCLTGVVQLQWSCAAMYMSGWMYFWSWHKVLHLDWIGASWFEMVQIEWLSLSWPKMVHLAWSWACWTGMVHLEWLNYACWTEVVHLEWSWSYTCWPTNRKFTHIIRCTWKATNSWINAVCVHRIRKFCFKKWLAKQVIL